MADYPFIHNFTTGRQYYGPSLQSPQTRAPQWLTEEQKDYYSQAHPASKLWLAAAAASGAIASGFIPTGQGRLWDFYVRGIRAVEEYSPAGILRTFQLSSFFSQFESAGRAGLPITADLLKKNQPYAQYLSKVIGTPEAWQRITEEGVTLKGGKLFYSQTGDVALNYAAAIRVPQGASSYWGSGFARSIGASNVFTTGNAVEDIVRVSGRKVPLAHAFFAQAQPFFGDPRILNPTLGGMPVQIIGAQNPFQYAGRQAGAWGTEFVSRFNRLLKAPFEMEPFRTVFGGLQRGIHSITGKEVSLAVKEAAGSKMLGALSLKYGLGLGAIYMGYQTIDYMVRNADILDNTVLAEGVTTGIATLGTRANIMLSRVAELTGLHAYREKQEEIAPGSTSLQKLLAFPLIGGMGAGFSSYFAKIAAMGKMQLEDPNITAAGARLAVTERMQKFTGKGPWSGIGQALTKQEGLFARQDLIGKMMRMIATPARDGEISYKLLGKLGPTKLATALGMGIGAALVAPFLPGALIPSTHPEELEAIYSGEQEVGIRKGRYWEFGRSPFEGKRIMYYRPHWYPRMLMRAREKAIWGEEEGELSPLSKWWRSEFTYELERRHYKERPYPITSLPFEDVPFIGPLLAHTLGKLIKPPLLMHTEEWMGDEGLKAMPPRFGGRVATEIGEKPSGLPISPTGLKGLVGEQAYRMTEMIGLSGFAMVSMKEALTGTGDLYDQMSQLESARRIASFERYYWDLELGGLMGNTEAFRRLYPHRRRQIPLYNPIRNMMPEWLPGPGEKSPDFLHGDSFTKVPEGELRLPGAGYIERFPELEGLKPEDYPLIHKWKVLADVAPWSDKYKQHSQMVRAARKRDDWGEYEEKIYQTTLEQVAARKVREEFQPYQYLSPMGKIFDDRIRWGGEEGSSLVQSLNELARTKDQQKDGVIKKLFGGYWELLAHNAETAIDTLTPIAPAAKLVHTRTALEAYERNQVYGTENAFWQHPLRDFIKPFTRLLGKSLGASGVPSGIEEKRSLEEYFDMLQYVKYSRLSNLARASGDSEALKEFEAKKDQTLFGINPFTRNYTSVFRALPRRERDYFNSFAEASSPEERARILELVPNNEKALYVARWKLAFADEVKKAEKAGILSEAAREEADVVLDKIYEEAKTEGFPTSQELFAEYVATRMPGENYGDWYRRTRLLAKVEYLPGPDWCFPGDTLVLTDKGYKPISQIKRYDKVWTRKGIKTVAANKNRYVDENIVEIEWSQDTDNKLVCTLEHPLHLNGSFTPAHLAKVGDSLEIVKLDIPDCKRIDISRLLPADEYRVVWGEHYSYDGGHIISKKPGPNQRRLRWVETTDDFYWMLGWFLAEGNIRFCDERWRGIEFTLNLDEEDIATKLADVLQRVFLKRPIITKRYRETGNSISVILNQKIAAHVMSALCGMHCYNKTPAFVGSLRQQKIAADACLQGDGSFEKNRAVLNTTSQKLALWFRDVNMACGNNVSYRRQERVNRRDSFRISVLNTEQKLRVIKSITSKRYRGEVYNLQVEDPSEFYTILGLVHNCGWHPSVDLQDIKLKVVQTIGEDMHDYDIWQDQARDLINKPYINDEAIQDILNPEELTEGDIRSRINDLLTSSNVRGDVFIRTATGTDNGVVDVDVEGEPDYNQELRRAFW